MKNRIIFIAASLAAVLASSCSKETDFRKEDDGFLQIPVTIHARYGDADTRVTYTENGAEITAKWDSGDKLLVVYDGQVSTLDLASGAGSEYATFSGTIQGTTAPSAGSVLNCFVQDAKNPGALVISGSSVSFSNGAYTSQDGTVAGAAKCNVYSGMATYGDGNVNCNFSVNCAMLKFTILDIGAHKDKTATLAYKSGDNTLAQASWTVIEGYNTVYLAVPAGNYSGEQTLQYSCPDMSASSSKVLSADHANFKPGSTYSKSIVFLPQYFYSVSASNQVRFSPGNLQYQPSTDTWRFGEHQWSFVGDGATTYQHGNVLEGGVRSNNELIDASYTGWIDLFGWGTWTGPGLGQSTVLPTNYFKGVGILYYDWADNDFEQEYKLQNELQRAYDWRTLSIDEWDYLLNQRNGNRYTMATINEEKRGNYFYPTGDAEHGIIIFPDGFSIPTENPDDFRWSAINEANGFATYCTVNGWNILEAAGCVFLPAAGYREGTTVSCGPVGRYWSSTSTDSNQGRSDILLFSSTNNFTGLRMDENYRYFGYSVRLVYDVN